ncbi:MAG: hypothetical protein H7Z18_00335 [Methylophilaceae bacterium]|nr:hypothetical protein [Methylophilaceae bacterium]
MKLIPTYLLPTILLAVLASACGKKEALPPVEPTPIAAPAAAPAAAVVPEQPKTGGGYESTAEERIPGITLPADAVAAPTVESSPVETPAAK